MPIDHFGMEPFGKSHFGMDVSSREHFGMCTFLRWEHFDMGTFRPEDFLAQRIFGTGKFWHGDISAHGQFGTVAQIVVFLGLVSKF